MKRVELTEVKFVKFKNEQRWTAKAKIPGYPRGRTMAIFNLNGELIAMPSMCPHEGANFIEGLFIDNETIECPAHQNRYNIYTDLKSYPVEMEDDKMFLSLEGERKKEPVLEVKEQNSSAEINDLNTNNSADSIPAVPDKEEGTTASEYLKRIKVLTNELAELRTVKAAQEIQVVEGYQQIDRMLVELEEQKKQLKEQNEIVAKSNEFVKRIMDTMEESLIVVGTDCKISQVNKKLLVLLGYKQESVIGENPDVFFDREDLDKFRKKYIQGEQEVKSVIYHIISNNTQLDLIANLKSKTDESIVHLVRGSLLYNTRGKKDGLVLVCTNILELQRIQNELIATLEKVKNLQKESERLLLNILPEQVATELRSVGSVKPVYFESASVMFTDFKGFTNLAESMSPEDLIKVLDTCFTKFDEITSKYKIEKLKTIGDSYMCAGGIPKVNKSHAIDCCLAALEIVRYMDEIRKVREAVGLPYFELRLGIHTGPIVAGVVGNTKFAYDIWGDSVNTASRMESSGEPGRVNISLATHELVKSYFVCESRGKIYAKRKGDMEMFFVNRIDPEFSKDEDGFIPNQKLLYLLESLRT